MASIILNYLEKDGRPVIHGMGYISEWKINNGKVFYNISDTILNELLLKSGRSMFLLMDWSVFNSLPGKYCGILYKLCKDYAGIGKTPYFTVQEFRHYLGLNDKEYEEFRALKAKIIKPAIEHINNSENVDIKIIPQLNQNMADEDIETAFSESKIEPLATLIKFLETKTPRSSSGSERLCHCPSRTALNMDNSG
ncbi:replication initiation protein [Neisseria meningitidis]|uniref:replication initiation protein n=1 Tax=Neisseria meningitidis TaxID=487 RepID=UPI0003301441|nr:initiator Replication family protein [Neisseria meningitidis 81858]